MISNIVLPILLLLSPCLGIHLNDNIKRKIALESLNDVRRALGALPGARQLPFGGSDYAPYRVSCPDNFQWIRPADGIGSGEAAFLQQRKQVTQPAINSMLSKVNLTSPPRLPILGVALSGGGYRAMQVGSGMVQALMANYPESATSGLGGWLDGMAYMAGLSGGSWATGSFMINGGRLPTDLVNDVWNLASDLVVPSDDKLTFYYDLVSEVNAKQGTGFQTQITDLWALALGNHLLPPQYRLDTSPNVTFAQLPAVVPAYANASLPMPIIISVERAPGTTVIPENSTVYEFTPYEFGSWSWGNTSKTVGAFTSIEYLGSSLDNGQPNDTTCFKGFDQLSFVMGTSSTLFNNAIIELDSANASSVVVDAATAISEALGDADNDVALYPNPFANWNASNNPNADSQYITLVDGGEDNRNIPVEPLLIPERAVDAILAFDSSADTPYSWPNGSSLVVTYQSAMIHTSDSSPNLRMPPVPSTNGFINGELNTRPVFFGCNDTELSSPIIIYVPSYPWSTPANYSTLQLQYDNSTATQLVLNGLRSLTLNGTVREWPQCLACALSDRSFGYTSQNRSSVCQKCFDRWCWDGKDNTTQPASYEPRVGSVPNWLVEQGLANQTTTSSGTSSSASPSASGKNSGASQVKVMTLGGQIRILLTMGLMVMVMIV
ncbi:hypothetical protein TREMEDRAFT_45759 [Tremella mesenterica DSM 1558]|uniref:uncharacterized protein n=1 Tax=Tremella mesenterica (strain ATCC 24925 / CBS 8224 / DSM 1558 / NBRC 9311 / NRRL Y-6157 / RJB 2259-6 / UBC 559-6) TaxID=578456 RepID=UPI00032B9BD2|nr:uncharacterized protein TREMEDRAFT_45759 [Tremella mesenterica DSM 1558]EIW66264.1 hypothetical protein TREMEDRAFT_45759 [Tremella mesenterica DSM 1558]